jgi:hypothetical protein
VVMRETVEGSSTGRSSPTISEKGVGVRAVSQRLNRHEKGLFVTTSIPKPIHPHQV